MTLLCTRCCTKCTLWCVQTLQLHMTLLCMWCCTKHTPGVYKLCSCIWHYCVHGVVLNVHFGVYKLCSCIWHYCVHAVVLNIHSGVYNCAVVQLIQCTRRVLWLLKHFVLCSLLATFSLFCLVFLTSCHHHHHHHHHYHCLHRQSSAIMFFMAHFCRSVIECCDNSWCLFNVP